MSRSTENADEELTVRGCPKYRKPSLALKLGHSLKKLAEIKRGQCMRSGDDAGKNDAENYILLHETEWAEKVSSHALQTLAERKFNEPSLLPLTEDVVKLKGFLLKEMQTLITLLNGSQVSVSIWRDLAMATLCRVTVFNKRRGGETGQMLLSSYVNRRTNWKEAENLEVTSTLEPLEIKLMNRYIILYNFSFQKSKSFWRSQLIIKHFILYGFK